METLLHSTFYILQPKGVYEADTSTAHCNRSVAFQKRVHHVGLTIIYKYASFVSKRLGDTISLFVQMHPESLV